MGLDKDRIAAALAALPAPVDPDAVDKTIGNDSWTHEVCDMCGEQCAECLDVAGEYQQFVACLGCAKKIEAAIAKATRP